MTASEPGRWRSWREIRSEAVERGLIDEERVAEHRARMSSSNENDIEPTCCTDAREADPWKEWVWHDH